jgi:hypothetical protein
MTKHYQILKYVRYNQYECIREYAGYYAWRIIFTFDAPRYNSNVTCEILFMGTIFYELSNSERFWIWRKECVAMYILLSCTLHIPINILSVRNASKTVYNPSWTLYIGKKF